MSKEPFETMRIWLVEDYPEHAAVLLKLCADDNGQQPLLFDQVELATDFYWPHSEKIPRSALNEFHAGYSYLAAGLFCLDAVIDGHPRGIANGDVPRDEVARATLLFFTGSLIRLSRALHLADCEVATTLSAFQKMVSQNMLALRDESLFQENPLEPNVEAEFGNIVGRANIFVFLFRIVALLSGRKCTQPLENALQSFLFYLQLGDDVGDWREDFLACRHTSFLRSCFYSIGKIPDLGSLEQHIYLSGAYEKRLAFIVKGLISVRDQLREAGGSEKKLFAYVESQMSLSMQGIKDFVECKKRLAIPLS